MQTATAASDGAMPGRGRRNPERQFIEFVKKAPARDTESRAGYKSHPEPEGGMQRDGGGNHSRASASTGSRRAALRAGSQPLSMPMAHAHATAAANVVVEKTTETCGTNVATSQPMA